MDIGIAGPIFTHKNIKGYMGQLYPYSTKWAEDIVAIPIFLDYFWHVPQKNVTKTNIYWGSYRIHFFSFLEKINKSFIS